MSDHKTSVLIIGGGLSGLALGYLLSQKDIDFHVLEARDRLGGRIYTHRNEAGASIEMGATWLGEKHTALWSLLEELGLGVYPQHIDSHAIYDPGLHRQPQLLAMPQQEPSYRISGGSSALIDALAQKLHTGSYTLNAAVDSIEEHEGQLRAVLGNGKQWLSDRVVCTLPPNLMANSIHFDPPLPLDLRRIAEQTHTWMGESIKAGVYFKSAFWRDGNGSTLFSPQGPFTELYEHSNEQGEGNALKGFLPPAYAQLSREQRESMVWEQLGKCLGPNVQQEKLGYVECVWAEEPRSFYPYKSGVSPHQYNGHPIYQEAFSNGRLYLGGSETSPQYGGYMDGAVRAANRVFGQLLEVEG